VVEALAGHGAPQVDIARVLHVSPMTLRRHYRLELDRGSTIATVRVAANLRRFAVTGKGQSAVRAAIFWLKARAGWREVGG
jgi:hypothetical protein